MSREYALLTGLITPAVIMLMTYLTGEIGSIVAYLATALPAF